MEAITTQLTPAQCREARHKLGLSASQMARALGLSDGRSVRRFEADHGASAGDSPKGPCAKLYRLILTGRIGAADLADS